MLLFSRYKFLEVRYRRVEKEAKSERAEPWIETVAVFVPDVWSLMPTQAEFELAQERMKTQLQEKLAETEKTVEKALDSSFEVLESAPEEAAEVLAECCIVVVSFSIVE